MDQKSITLELIKKHMSRLHQLGEKEKVRELMLLLRLVYPLLADTKGSQILELYTRLKTEPEKALKEAEEFIKSLEASLSV
ncbi:MAG: hypothetical protein GXO04_02680 [Aquificae bacterium]|nr:hypothetical protein [Aquificota bacterium]